MRWRLCTLVMLDIFFGCAQFVIAEEAPAPITDDKTLLDKYFPYEQRVAGWVDNSARSIDAFFGTNDAWRTDNQSWLRITNDFRWDQSEHGSEELRARLKLDLPTARENLHLLFENDNPEQRTATQEAVPSLRNVNDERNTVLGLGADLDSWAPAWNKKLQAGIRVALPLDPYTRFIAKRSWQLDDNWELNSYNRLAWFNRDGYSANSEIRFGKTLAPNWHLDYTTDLTWREDRDYLQFAETANLAHVLSTRSAINYSAGVIGTGLETPEIAAYFLTADYRRNLSRRIVFIDVIPELTFPKDEKLNPHWAITFRLELYFQKNVVEDD